MQESSNDFLISVVVPVYNGETHLADCIESLLTQDFPQDQYEVIIVNNRSTDATEDIAKSYPVRVLNERIPGPAAARNMGILAAKASFVAFTDADCLPNNDWLSQMMLAMQDEITGVGGEIISYHENDLISSHIDKVVFRQRYNITQKSPPHITTANALYRRSDLLKIGLFDVFFPNAAGEDRDLGERLSSTGKKLVFAPTAIVRHNHPQTLETFYQQRFRHATGQFYADLKLNHKPAFFQVLLNQDIYKPINLFFKLFSSLHSKKKRSRVLISLVDVGAYTTSLLWHHLLFSIKSYFSVRT